LEAGGGGGGSARGSLFTAPLERRDGRSWRPGSDGPDLGPAGPSRPRRVGLLTPSEPHVCSWWWCGAEQVDSSGDAYVQQHGGGDFTGPIWPWPGLMGLVCPCCRVRSAPAAAVEDVLQVVVLLPPPGSDPPTSFDSQVARWTCYSSASSRMPGRRPRKVDCTGGSTAGDVTVVMAVSWSHEGGE
jgi:hypothetical protein